MARLSSTGIVVFCAFISGILLYIKSMRRKVQARGKLADDLAVLMACDIRDRGLCEGDRYYTTDEAGKAFGVSKETARKAMQLLAEKHVLVRLRRRGTFVGAEAGQAKRNVNGETVVLLPSQLPGARPRTLNLFPAFLDQAIDTSNIRIHMLPADRDISALRQLLEPAMAAGKLDGVITTSRTRAVHEYLSESGIPVVLLGTLDSGMPDLPSVDIDYHESGRLLAEYAVAQGHRHVIVQLAQDFGGNHHFADGVTEALSAARLPPNSMKLRSFNGDSGTTRANYRDLLGGKDRPTAVLADGIMLAEVAADAARDMKLRIGRDVAIFWSADAMRVEDYSPYVHALPVLGMDEVAMRVARMLKDQRDQRILTDRHVSLPVEIRVPRKHKSA
jgi:DNA-binding LacI/PurR family transcriptional regulator